MLAINEKTRKLYQEEKMKKLLMVLLVIGGLLLANGLTADAKEKKSKKDKAKDVKVEAPVVKEVAAEKKEAVKIDTKAIGTSEIEFLIGGETTPEQKVKADKKEFTTIDPILISVFTKKPLYKEMDFQLRSICVEDGRVNVFDNIKTTNKELSRVANSAMSFPKAGKYIFELVSEDKVICRKVINVKEAPAVTPEAPKAPEAPKTEEAKTK